MPEPARKVDRRYTWEDYKTWPDDERWEIIGGEAYCMTPAPSIKHQRISGNLCGIIYQFFKGHPCELFVAPTDVVLDEENIVQPDVFICDKNKITEANIQGAPDLIIEILSPSTSLKDRRVKKALYERFGVKEYIIVNPLDETVERFTLIEGKYRAQEIFNWDEALPSSAFHGLEINLSDVFGKGKRSAD